MSSTPKGARSTRRSLWIVSLLLALTLAGCIGDGGSPGDVPGSPSSYAPSRIRASVDHSRPAARTGANLTSALPATEADPRAGGPLEVEQQRYDFGWTVVNASRRGPAYHAKLNGTVTYPSNSSGDLPVVVFLHGQHATCAVGEVQLTGTQVCPDVLSTVGPVPNAAGYGYVGETLASLGYAVVSIDGKSINDRGHAYVGPTPADNPQVGDAGIQARAQLILRTLDGFEAVDGGEDPGPPVAENLSLVEALEGRLDMESVGLVGHSRGGDGVSYAVRYNHHRAQGSPHDIRAVFAIAPTDYTDARVPGVPFATLLPYCDGDVDTLEGARIYDRSRYLDDGGPLYQYVAMGANHNFYNTVWTDDFDDADSASDPFCGSFREDGGGRLSAPAQRRHGEALIVAFLEVHLGGDDTFRSWLRGRSLPPSSACPPGEAPCPGLIHTSYHPAGSDRLVLESVRDGNATETNDLGGPIQTTGQIEARTCRPEDCPSQPNRQLADQLTLSWRGAGRYEVTIPEPHADVSDHRWVSLRAGVNFDAGENDGRIRQRIALELEDRSGETANVSSSGYGDALFVPPGRTSERWTSEAEVTLSTIRVPLAAFEGVDLDELASVSIVTERGSEGSIQVADVMLQR